MDDKEQIVLEEAEKQKERRKKNKEDRRKAYMLVLLVFVLFIGITIGYAALTTSLKIQGDVEIKTPKWDIHFDNICIGDKCDCEHRTDCCAPGQPCGGGDYPPVCKPEDTTCNPDYPNCPPGVICTPPTPVPSLPRCTGPGKCIPELQQLLVKYSVVFDTPGQYYDFTVDVVNDGYFDAVVSENPSPAKAGLTAEHDVYTNYIVTYANGEEVKAGDKLKAGSKATIYVRVEYDKNTPDAQLPTSDVHMDLTFTMNYKQANVD